MPLANYLSAVEFVDRLRILSIYAALIVLMGIGLTYLVILQRRSKKIGLGDRGDKQVTRLVRVHGNFVENAPFALALLIIMTLAGSSGLALHAVGLLFLLGRALHAKGLSAYGGSSIGRVSGMILTHTSFLIGVGSLLLFAFGR